MTRILTIVVAGTALVAGAVRGQSTEAMAPLAPGDAIRIAFWREPELNGEYPVDETGMVVLPLLGARSVSSFAPAQLKTQLTDDYAKELRTPDDVQIVLLRRVRVLGAVKEPGLFLVDPTMTLGDAVALAGGATADGKLNGIRIMRGGLEVRADLDQSTPMAEHLRSGDQILVPQKSWLSRNTTLVIGGGLSAAALIIANLIK